MKHPRENNGRRLTATVPSLSGGLDLSTAPTLIADNALSDGRDMWWQKGTLCCRPGFTTDEHHCFTGDGSERRFFVDREGYRLMTERGHGEESGDFVVTVFAPDGTPTDNGIYLTGAASLNGFLVPAGGSVSAFSVLLFVNDGTIYGALPSRGVWEELNDRVYVPLRMVLGKPVLTRAETAVTGVLFEGINRLTPRFRCTFSSDGAGVYYTLPETDITGEVTVERGGITQTVPLGQDSSPAATDGLVVRIDRAAGVWWFERSNAPTPLADAGMRNNITVTAEACRTGTVLPTGMGFGTWFGGDRSGAPGGTRLFLAGSPTDPSLLMWSDLNAPLYFPENNYAVVGTPDRGITALGKQGEKLILFKERELYAASYLQGDTLSGDALLAGEVTDAAAAAAVFPLTPLHPTIGCDLPATVAMPGNRLMWACSDGRVYTLTETDKLSACRVEAVSDNIAPLLQQTPSMTAAVAKDGRYWLLWGDTLFTYEETPKRWHRFVWPDNGTEPVGMYLSGTGKLLIPATRWIAPLFTAMFTFTLSGERDTVIAHTGDSEGTVVFTLTDRAVTGSCCTRAYDFGTPEKEKRVTGLFAELAAESTVTVGYLTERGEQSDLPLAPDATGGFTATPHLMGCRRLAVRLTGERLRVGSLTLRMTEHKWRG